MRGIGGWWVAAGCLTLGMACGGATETASESTEPGAAQTLPIDTPQGGTVAWVRQLGGLGDERVIHAAPAPDGGVVLLTFVGDATQIMVPHGALGVVRLDSNGAIRWSRQIPVATASVKFYSIATSGMGNVFVALQTTCTIGTDCPNFGGGEATGAMLVKLDPSGRFVWQRNLAAEEIRSALAVDPNGGTAVAVRRRDASGTLVARLLKYRWDGAPLLDVAPPAVNGAGIASDPSALAFDPSGNLVIGDRLAFSSVDPNGVVRWTAHLADPSVQGGFVGIGTTALGTVVAVVAHFQGTVSWAGTESTVPAGRVNLSHVLVVAENNGAPRFARVLTPVNRAVVPDMAVDPAGRVAVPLLGVTSDCREPVEKWNLAGDLLWTFTYPGCTPPGAMFATTVAFDPVTHHVVFAGALVGTVDLGTGPVTSRGAEDGIVIDLRP